MQQFGWTLLQFEQRPLWFDVLYPIKLEAEAEYQKAKSNDGGNK